MTDKSYSLPTQETNIPANLVRANDGIHEAAYNALMNAGVSRGDQILDVGCGTGAFLMRLHSGGFTNVTGLDISVPQRVIAGVSYASADLDFAPWPLPSAKYKAIVAIEVVEHIENLGVFIAELRRLLAPGGQIIITTPNVHSIEARLRYFLKGELKQFDHLSDPTHLAPQFFRTITRLTQRHSLRLEVDSHCVSDNTSQTSRPILRLLSRIVGFLGVPNPFPGDTIVFVLRHSQTDAPSSKLDRVTGHYPTR